MPAANFAAVFFTVALLVITAYFLMGGLPLLILRHDTPVDAKFVGGFFNIYYKAIVVAAAGACVSFALADRGILALGAVAVAVLALALRRQLLPAMQNAAAKIDDSATNSAQFRKLHALALVANLIQLVAIIWCLVSVAR